MKLLITCFALSCIVVAVQADLSSLEVLEILKMVQTNVLEVQERVARTPDIMEDMSKMESNDKLQNLLDEYIGILDGIQSFVINDEKNVETVLKWITERISASSGLIYPLRIAREQTWAAEEALQKLKTEWKECDDKLNRAPDFTNEEQKMETVINVVSFVESLESLKEAIVRLEKAVTQLERYILIEENA